MGIALSISTIGLSEIDKKLFLKYDEFSLIHKKKQGFFITLNEISLPISKIILLLKLFRG